ASSLLIGLSAANAVVRRFFGHHYVVWMALAQARAGHANEARSRLERLDVLRADVAHPLAQPAHELEDDVGEHALLRHARLDALADQVRLVATARLEVAIFAITAALHRADGPHAAVVFVALAL